MLQSDDGSRLRVNGKPVIDLWGPHAVETQFKTLNLEAGKTYDFAIEYYQGSGEAVIRFGWAPIINNSLSPEAVAQIAQADAAIVCVGFNNHLESEGGDRSYQLPKGQEELIQSVAKANPRTVVVLNAGGNVEMANWIDQVPGLIHAWYPGEMGGTALAEILFGDVNPSGKLPASFEKQWEDAAAFGNFPATARKIHYAEGVFVGYRHFDAKNIEPRFPFGYGLSYTTFAYGKAQLSAKTLAADGTLLVAVLVTNTGKCAGAEIVQLYVHDANASVPRPPQELKGFQKLLLKPGETQTASFTITAADLSFWDVKTHAWKAEPGTFEIRLGSSSRDLRAKEEFELK
jgi:beta-glucosidase